MEIGEAVRRGPVSLVLHNACVYGVGAERSRARAVASVSGRIAAVGDDESVLALAGSGTKVVDCRGGTLLPGFIDSHVHLLGYAGTFFGVDCSPSRATSIAALQALIREQASETPPGSWVRAHGYHQYFLDGGRHPTRWELDAAAPRHPVRLLHQNRHICVLNSLALQVAGIDRDTPNPPDGLIEKDIDRGEPTGLLVGMYAWVSEHVVPPLGPDELEKGIGLAAESFLSQGVTCIHDAGQRNGIDDWHLFDRLAKMGRMPLRMRMMVGSEGLDAVLSAGLTPQCGSPHLRLGAVKIVVEQVEDRLHLPSGQLRSQVRKAHDAGFQVAIHAITPRAVRAAVEAIRGLGDGEGRRRRHRIEHCTFLSPVSVRLLAESGATVVGQPSFVFYNGSRYLGEVPVEKFAWVCRGQSLVRQGVPLVGSTDCPVVPNSILAGIGAAVSRESQVGFVFGSREKVAPEEAISMFTAAGAHASFEESEMGSVKVGGVADFVVLDRDPRQVQPGEIRRIRPEVTVVGGEVVWVKDRQDRASLLVLPWKYSG